MSILYWEWGYDKLKDIDEMLYETMDIHSQLQLLLDGRHRNHLQDHAIHCTCRLGNEETRPEKQIITKLVLLEKLNQRCQQYIIGKVIGVLSL